MRELRPIALRREWHRVYPPPRSFQKGDQCEIVDEQITKIALAGDDILRLLLELEAFRVCPPLGTDDFVKLCRANDLIVSTDLIEQFEKNDLFYPLFRVRLPISRTKLRRLEDGRFEDCGSLEVGEHWDGQVRERYVRPNPDYHDLREWLDDGLIYSPESRDFQQWESFLDKNHRKTTENYYSVFQVYALRCLVERTTTSLNLASIVDYSDDDFEKLKIRLRSRAATICDSSSRLGSPQFDAVILAQTISSRYYPEAQGDLRTITTPGEWDWYAYSHAWSAENVVARLGISAREVRRYYELVDSALSSADPLEDWDDLLAFVYRSRKEKLKGAAQYGQALRTIRDMFGLFFEELTGEPLKPRKGTLAKRYALNEGYRFTRTQEDRNKKVSQDVELLEFVVNRYGLNPRPDLVLFVEGSGENAAFPRLAERIFGLTLAVCGIEVRNLRGNAGFTGSRKDRYGALEKVIEELHLSQTVVFVVLDNEGHGVPKLRDKLTKKESKYYPKRTVIRREFIHIWETSIEFDNFSDQEIATVLTTVSKGRYEFTEDEVTAARASFGQEPDPISSLFKNKVDYCLQKIDCLCALVDQISPEEASEPVRPLVILLDQVLRIAGLNHKPTFVDMWFENQESGCLGHPAQGDDPMAERFAALSRIQKHLRTKQGR